MKIELKEKAIRLRGQGKTYTDILKEVPVAKSTLSLWLRSVGLSERQKQRITTKKLIAARRGAETRRLQRILKTKEIKNEAKREIGKISSRELWLMGVMLYWAEGSKEKEWRPGSGVEFVNSDPDMIVLFLKWLMDICGVRNNELKFIIHIHQSNKSELEKIKRFWSRTTKFPISSFSTVYFKKHKLNTNKKYINTVYYGVLVIQVKASSSFNRKIAGWVKGVIESS